MARFIRIRSSLAACVVLMLASCAAETPQPPPKPAVVIQPQLADARRLESYAGTLAARHQSELGFRVGGKVLRRRVDVGAEVEAGTLLAELERTDFELQVNAARATVASANADAAFAAAELERHRELIARKLVSESLLDAKINADAAARARLKQAESELAVAANAADYTALRAPVAGVITGVGIEAGQVVASGVPVISLAQSGAVEALIAIPEGKVGDFSIGEAVRVSLWIERDLAIAGVIREIAPAADPRTRTYDVRVTLIDPPPAAQLGMSVRIGRASASADGNTLLAVPLTAITEIAGRASVWVVDGDTKAVRSTPVEVASWTRERALISGGIDERTWLVGVGVHKLAPGQVIQPIDRANRVVDLARAP